MVKDGPGERDISWPRGCGTQAHSEWSADAQVTEGVESTQAKGPQAVAMP